MKKLTIIEFIEKARKIHDNKYDYSKVNYINGRNVVKILCKRHGLFQQTPSNHLAGQNCPVCMNKGKSNVDRFINSAKQVHGERYDYSIIKYLNNKTKINIICKEHGIFEQIPTRHLCGDGCSKCNGGVISNYIEFINKANNIHNNIYDYSKVNYINSQTKVKIICSEHGVFEMKPNNHLLGQCCPQCKNKSFGEKYINNWLINHSIKFERQKSFNDCKNSKLLKFDFWIPNKNTLIKYDGKQHYVPIEHMGGEMSFKSVQTNDKIKTKYAMNNNLNLLRIPYTERKNLSNILKIIL